MVGDLLTVVSGHRDVTDPRGSFIDYDFFFLFIFAIDSIGIPLDVPHRLRNCFVHHSVVSSPFPLFRL